MTTENYIIVQNNNNDMFRKEVNKRIEEGYRPVGEMQHGFFQDYFYMQTMFKTN